MIPQLAIQIFATDISDFALSRARSGIYSASEVQGVSKERLKRFFVRHDTGYQIHKSVRELCIFAKQNIIKDPPFSNLDMISCRNVLIYFGPILQKRAIPTFHYALKPRGYLTLGPSESLDRLRNYSRWWTRNTRSIRKNNPMPTSPCRFLDKGTRRRRWIR